MSRSAMIARAPEAATRGSANPSPMRSLRIAHIVPSFYPALYYGGPTRSGYELCKHLAADSCQVRVLTTDANGPEVLSVTAGEEVTLAPGLQVRYMPRKAGDSLAPGLLTHLRSYVQWCDVVHLVAVYSFPTIPTLALARSLGKPVVWSPRGSLQRWAGTRRVGVKQIWERVCRAASPAKTVLHVTSEEEASASTERMPGMRAAVIPNGVEIPERTKSREREGALRMLYLGRLDPIKGIENLLRACQLLSGVDWKLTLAGTGDGAYVDTLRALAAQLSLESRVVFAGQVSGAEKEDVLFGSDLVVVPSHTENFGMVVVEALAHGVPVIASQGTPWKELPHYGCGLWVPNEPSALAASIREMDGMPLGEMGRRGREWMEQDFSWNQVAKRMAALYGELAACR